MNDEILYKWENTDDGGWKFYVLREDPFHPENELIVIGVSRMDTYAGHTGIMDYHKLWPIDFVNPLDEI